MVMTGSAQIDAEGAFARRGARAGAARSRAGSAPNPRARRLPSTATGRCGAAAQRRRGIGEIPLEAICGTLEPSRATLFDRCFRPAASARRRWQRLWVAEQRGAVLPPISVVAVGDLYAIRDGHHRVSVARARGAMTIDASVADAL